jgi:hypothetical protein
VNWGAGAAMTVEKHATREIHGCILLIPSDLFRALEREAARQALSPEAFLLRLIESRVAESEDAPAGRHG